MGRLQRTRKLTERCVTRRFHRQMSRLVGDTTMLWSSSSGSSRADRCHRSQKIRPGRGRSSGPSTADRLATSNLLTFVPQFQSNRQLVATLQLCPAKLNSHPKYFSIESKNSTILGVKLNLTHFNSSKYFSLKSENSPDFLHFKLIF